MPPLVLIIYTLDNALYVLITWAYKLIRLIPCKFVMTYVRQNNFRNDRFTVEYMV